MHIKLTERKGTYGADNRKSRAIFGTKTFSTITVLEGGRGWKQKQVYALLSGEPIQVEEVERNGNEVTVRLLSGQEQLVSPFSLRPYVPKTPGKFARPQVIVESDFDFDLSRKLKDVYGVSGGELVVVNKNQLVK